jgi:3-phosphoshikimate 1-carboxyvinyltransferase
MIDALRHLGFEIETQWNARPPYVTVEHSADAPKNRIPATKADLLLGNSGTSMRFVAAILSLGRGCYRLDGDQRMRQRPMGDLLVALESLGIHAKSERGDGCPPIAITSDGLRGGSVTVRADSSSQFLSGLLLAAPLAENDLSIHVEGPMVSAPYIHMTVEMMRSFGARVSLDGPRTYSVPGNQRYQLAEYEIEPDATAAGYFFTAAAITGGTVTVTGLTPESLQGDIRFVKLLEEMGCRCTDDGGGITVEGGQLRGIEADMSDISDCVMSLAAVACFATGRTRIRNVAHIRLKESDRLAALCNELTKLGAGVHERSDGIEIVPKKLRGAVVETYGDHRIAMSLALLGLRIPGIVIRDPSCVRKTYPSFFADLNRLYEEANAC